MIHTIDRNTLALLTLTLIQSQSTYTLPPEIDMCFPEVVKTKLAQARKIVIQNNITNEMIDYNHWSGLYHPEFSIEINGQKLKPGEEIEINLEYDILDIMYIYSFAHGFCTGKRTCHLTVPLEENHFSLIFTWNEHPHIKLEPIQPKKAQ